jgi:amphiphysin
MKISESIDTFYGATDRTSEGAMAANAYRRSTEELDSVVGNQLVSLLYQASTLGG